MPDWLLNVNWVSGSANATTVQRDEEAGEDQMTAVGVGVGEHVGVDVNPHSHSRSASEDKNLIRSGDVTPKREVTFLEREGGEKERGNQGDEVNVVVPAASTSAPASEDGVMPTTAAQALSRTAQPLPSTVTSTTLSPTAQVPSTMTTTSTQHATGLSAEMQQNVVADPVLKVVRFPSAQ